MTTPDPAFKIQSLILRRLAQEGQRRTADAIGVNDSQLSRFTGGDAGLKFDQLCQMLAELGLTVVQSAGGETVTITAEKYNALRVLAREGLE